MYLYQKFSNKLQLKLSDITVVYQRFCKTGIFLFKTNRCEPPTTFYLFLFICNNVSHSIHSKVYDECSTVKVSKLFSKHTVPLNKLHDQTICPWFVQLAVW